MNLNISPPCLPQLVNKKKKKYIRKQHDNKITHELQANLRADHGHSWTIDRKKKPQQTKQFARGPTTFTDIHRHKNYKPIARPQSPHFSGKFLASRYWLVVFRKFSGKFSNRNLPHYLFLENFFSPTTKNIHCFYNKCIDCEISQSRQ